MAKSHYKTKYFWLRLCGDSPYTPLKTISRLFEHWRLLENWRLYLKTAYGLLDWSLGLTLEENKSFLKTSLNSRVAYQSKFDTLQYLKNSLRHRSKCTKYSPVLVLLAVTAPTLWNFQQHSARGLFHDKKTHGRMEENSPSNPPFFKRILAIPFLSRK